MKNKLMDPILIHKRHFQIMQDAELTSKQLGEVIRALLSYQTKGRLPEDMDPVSLAFWKVIHADMKREFGAGVR